MRIQVSGKQMDIGDALRTHVEGRLTEAVGKYFDRPVDALVIFCKDRHQFVADSSVHLSTGMTVQATARADEIYASFESAVERTIEVLADRLGQPPFEPMSKGVSDVHLFAADLDAHASPPQFPTASPWRRLAAAPMDRSGSLVNRGPAKRSGHGPVTVTALDAMSSTAGAPPRTGCPFLPGTLQPSAGQYQSPRR